LNPKRLVAIEKDTRFEPILAQLAESEPSLQAHFADILELETFQESLFEGEYRRVLLVGNLPFGIASVLLNEILKMLCENKAILGGHHLKENVNLEMLLMFQKEVAQVLHTMVSCFDLVENYGKGRG